MNRLIEQFYPVLGAFIAVYLWWRGGVAFPPEKDILSASLTIGAILTGFLGTSKTLLMTLDSSLMKRIRSTPYGAQLASYMGQAIWFCFAFCLISMFGFFLDTTNKYFGFGWIFIAILASLAFMRVTHIMLKIVKNNGK
jgi:hypothetical protein